MTLRRTPPIPGMSTTVNNVFLTSEVCGDGGIRDRSFLLPCSSSASVDSRYPTGHKGRVTPGRFSLDRWTLTTTIKRVTLMVSFFYGGRDVLRINFYSKPQEL